MGHQPHLFLPPPWPPSVIELANSQVHHLRRVLRIHEGETVTYTDGAGVRGEGRLVGEAVVRGPEQRMDPPTHELTLAVAPPREKDRVRFLVEKAAELEVARILWLEGRFSQGSPPPVERSRTWAIAGLEQSRGAFLIEVGEEAVTPGALLGGMPTDELWVADVDAGPLPGRRPARLTVAIGPEGGWAPGEWPPNCTRISLGRTVLRVETASLAVAALVTRI